MRLRAAVSVSAAVMLLALGACASNETPSAAPTMVQSSPTTADEPVPSTSPSVTPSRTPSMSPSPTVSRPPVIPPPPAGPISCTGSVPLTRPAAGGIGPGGSILKTGSDAVALTFDDGPDPVNTPKILELLKQCGAKATFCLVGSRLEAFHTDKDGEKHPNLDAEANTALVKQMVADGHTLCNHTWSHDVNLSKKSDEDIRKDLKGTSSIIKSAAPGAAVKYFRAPGGNFDANVVNIADELGMTSIYWHVDPRDWDRATYGTGATMQNHIIGEVSTKVRPGSIVLSHDNRKPDTITAYRTLLPWLKARFTLIALPTTNP